MPNYTVKHYGTSSKAPTTSTFTVQDDDTVSLLKRKLMPYFCIYNDYPENYLLIAVRGGEYNTLDLHGDNANVVSLVDSSWTITLSYADP
ncbi:hypothetical protein LPJ70_003560, partial [Coemansia sp. RSA 2708]